MRSKRRYREPRRNRDRKADSERTVARTASSTAIEHLRNDADREIPRKTLLSYEQQPPRHAGRRFEMTLDPLHGIPSGTVGKPWPDTVETLAWRGGSAYIGVAVGESK